MKKLLFALLLIPNLAFATNYYVATDGSDTNSGSNPTTDAFATVQKCIETVSATGGDTCFLVAGTYEQDADFDSTTVNSGVSGNPHTVKAYNGGTVIIETQNTLSGTTWSDKGWAFRDVSYWNIEDLIFQFGNGQFIQMGDRTSGYNSSPTDVTSYLTFTNVTWRNNKYNAVNIESAHDITFDGCTWQNLRKYLPHTSLLGSYGATGEVQAINAKLHAYNMTIQNSTFIDIGSDNIHTRPTPGYVNYNFSNWTLDNNEHRTTSPYVETDPDTGNTVSPPYFHTVGESYITSKHMDNGFGIAGWSITNSTFHGMRRNTGSDTLYNKTNSGSDLAIVSDGITSSSNDLDDEFGDVDNQDAPSIVIYSTTDATNNGWYRITDITPGKITIYGPDGPLTPDASPPTDTRIMYNPDVSSGQGAAIGFSEEVKGEVDIIGNTFYNVEQGINWGGPRNITALTDVAFNSTTDIISSASAANSQNSFSAFNIGDTIVVSNAGANSGTYTINSVTETQIAVDEEIPATQSGVAADIKLAFFRHAGSDIANNFFYENQQAPYFGNGNGAVTWVDYDDVVDTQLYNNTFIADNDNYSVLDVGASNIGRILINGAAEGESVANNLIYSNVFIEGYTRIGNLTDYRFWNNAYENVTVDSGTSNGKTSGCCNIDMGVGGSLKIFSSGVPKNKSSAVIGASFDNGLTDDNLGTARPNVPAIGAFELQ